MLILSGMLTFDGRVVLHRVGNGLHGGFGLSISAEPLSHSGRIRTEKSSSHILGLVLFGALFLVRGRDRSSETVRPGVSGGKKSQAQKPEDRGPSVFRLHEPWRLRGKRWHPRQALCEQDRRHLRHACPAVKEWATPRPQESMRTRCLLTAG